MVIVYIAERGLHEDRSVVGIFDSPERAMAAMGGKRWTRNVWADYPRWPNKARIVHHETWTNELDWGGYVSIYAMELTGVGPLHSPESIVIQTLNERGGWDYPEATAETADSVMGARGVRDG